MKALFFLLLLPFFAQAQTIHRKGNKILYEGEVPLSGRSASEVLVQLQTAANDLLKKGKQPAPVQTKGQTVLALADMQLNTDYSLVRTVNYTMQLTAKNGGYTYRIDSVYVLDKKRDGSESKHTAKELFDKMEVSGPVAEATERLLNEIDMNFQKLLALMKTSIQKESGQTK